MSKEELKKQANDFKNQLNNADDQSRVSLIQAVCDEMIVSHFRKVLTKYKAEAVLYLKKPRVNKTTRAAYREFCNVAMVCAKTEGNRPLMARISSFAAGL
ncbi:MAG: hypothetical protein IJ689_06350 [Alphaproteobacteria bacterium]|nr:hypothetical protein [Alphaproteobacteria bacterium]